MVQVINVKLFGAQLEPVEAVDTCHTCKAPKVEREVAEDPTPKHILTKARARLDVRWILAGCWMDFWA